jgi:uncharacterized DUF497 family protein
MLEFDWDTEKAIINQEKHGVSFIEAATVFDDPFAATLYDSLHSQEEERFVTIGYSDRYRLLIVVHTERNYHTRIISSRPATNQEKKDYDSN